MTDTRLPVTIYHREPDTPAHLGVGDGGPCGRGRGRPLVSERPLLLDLFCGAGGSAVGYYRAGFDVVGVDIKPQPRFPFRFIQGDALQPPVDLSQFAAIHASPPCQAYSRLRHLPWLKDKVYWDSIPPTLEFLESTGLPWVCENVPGSPLQGIELCGQSFGLPVYRHRLFASSVALMCPPHEKHRVVIGHGRMVNDRRGSLNAGSRAGAWGQGDVVTVTGGQCTKEQAQAALGIDWMTKGEMTQAIPPAYTEFIGRQLIRAVTP